MDEQNPLADPNCCDVAMQLNRCATTGHWKEALQLIAKRPELVDATRPAASAMHTALHIATTRGDLDVARKLVAAGANKALRLRDGSTALDVAFQKHVGNNELRALLEIPTCTLSQLLRREVDCGFDDLIAEAADRALFEKLCVALVACRCPPTPLLVVRELAAAFHRASGGVDVSGRLLLEAVSPASLQLGRWRAFFTALAASATRSFTTAVPPQRAVVADAILHCWSHADQHPLHAALVAAAQRAASAPCGGDLEGLLRAVVLAFDLTTGVANIVADAVAGAARWYIDIYSPQLRLSHPARSPVLPRHFYACREQHSPLFSVSPRGSVAWVAFGDWGEDYCTSQLAKGVADFLRGTGQRVDFLLLLGDNFYPCGVHSVEDKRFQRQWADAFLNHAELCVPHKIVLGNHDRSKGTGAVQVAFTDDTRNTLGLWQFRGESDVGAPAHHCYDFQCLTRHQAPPPSAASGTAGIVALNFFVIDTCATQFNSRKANPGIVERFKTEAEALKMRLAAARAETAAAGLEKRAWSFVAGHHGMYTDGSGHHDEGLCLRSDSYSFTYRKTGAQTQSDGLALEKLLVDAGVDAYFAGHDHVMQHAFEQGVDHIACGSAVDVGFYKGRHPAPARPVDWFDDSSAGFSFNRVVANPDGSSEFIAQFVRLSDGAVLREVRRSKGP